MEITLSFITPVYNRVEYVEKAVISVLASNRVDVEIILIDDCSTDSSSEICLRLAKRHDNIIFKQLDKNVGPGAARNIGLDLANGDYVYFLDSDDTVVTENLIKLLDVMHIRNADVFWLQALQINVNNQLKLANQYGEDFYNGDEFIRLFTTCPGNVSGWLFSYKTEFLRRHNIVFANGFGEDTLFAYNAVFMAETAYNFPYVINKHLMDSSGSLTTFFDKTNVNRMLSELRIAALMRTLTQLNLSFEKRESAKLLREQHMINVGRFNELFEMDAFSFADYSLEWTLILKYWEGLVEEARKKSNQLQKKICFCPYGSYSRIIYNRLSSMDNIPTKGFYDNNSKEHGISKVDHLEQETEIVLLATGTERVMNDLKSQIEGMGYLGYMYSRCVCILTK